MIIERYRDQILRGRKREDGLAGLAFGKTRSIDALRPDRAVLVIGAKGRIRPASGESEKQHQRNEDRRNTENEDEPVHANADCPVHGTTDCSEWAAPATGVIAASWAYRRGRA